MNRTLISGGSCWNSSRFLRAYFDTAAGGAPTGGGGDTPTIESISKSVTEVATSSKNAIIQITGKIDDLTKGAATKAEIAEFKAQLTKNQTDMEAINAYMQDLEKKYGIKNKGNEERMLTMQEAFAEIVSKNAEAIKGNVGIKRPLEYTIDKTAVNKADMSFSGNTTGTVIAPDFNPNIFGPPMQNPHIRTYVNLGTTSSSTYYFVQGSRKVSTQMGGITDPGALKTQLEYQFDGQSVPVLKITGYCRFPEEMADDIEGMTSFIQNYMPEDVFRKEDQQMLHGTGSANKQFNGFFNFAPAYTPSTGVTATESWDVLADVNAQLQNKYYFNTRTLVNPIDWMFLATRKSTDGIYSHPTLLYGTPLSIGGVPVTANPLIDIDKFISGWFPATELKVRRGLTLRFFDQDQDNAIKNMITVVCEMREAMATYYTDAYLQGDFGRVA